MVIDTLTTYLEWQQSFLAEIEVQPHTVPKGDVFVQNVKKIASTDFGDKLIFEVVDLKKIYKTYATYETSETDNGIKVDLHCRIVNVQDGAYIGVANLVNMYKMLQSYASQSDDEVD